MGKQRIHWIDASKGVAILLVMLAHLSEQASPVLTWLVYGYVPIFFVMSGLTYKPSDDWRTSLRRRSLRLWIPYVFYGLTILIAASLLSSNVSLLHGLAGLAYGRYCLYPIGHQPQIELLQGCYYLAPLWFLPCMWLACVLMLCQDQMTRKWILPVVALLISIAAQYKTILLPFSLDTCFMAFLFMESGRQLAKTKDYHVSAVISVLVFVVCVVLYYLAGTVNGETNMSLGVFGQVAPWSAFLFLILGLSESIGFSVLFQWIEHTICCRVFAYLGREALRLMCIHILFGSLFYKLLLLTHLPDFGCLMLSIAGVIGVNAVISYLIARWSRSFGKGPVSNL